MENADREHFDILFAGECLDGHDPTGVRAALGKLFRADEATLDKLFSGKAQRIKRGVDETTARKYEKAMEAAGARAILRSSASDDSPAQAAQPASADAQSANPAAEGVSVAADPSSLSLAPAGSDVLRPEERRVETGAAPATDHLSVAPAGEDLGETQAAPVDVKPVPEYDVAAVGTDLSDGSNEAVPAAPDTSNLSLSEGDLDLSDCTAPAAAPVAMNLDHLSVADAGGDLLADEEKVRSEAQAPDTSHLSLSDPDPALSDPDPS
jgi:hypothetical protein